MEERKIKKSEKIGRKHESVDKRAGELVGLEAILAGLEWMKSDLQRLRARYRWPFWFYESLGWITRGLSRFHGDFLKSFKELDYRIALLKVDLDRKERERQDEAGPAC